MIEKVALPALLAAFAFGIAPVAFAASNTSPPTPTLSPPPATSSAPSAPASGSKPAAQSTGTTTGEAQTTTAKMPPQAGASSKSISHYVGFSDRVDRKDIAAFGSATISLAKAMQDAANDMNGVAVEAVFKAHPANPHYVVWVMERGRVLTAYVDPTTGQVKPMGRAIATHRLFPSERAEFAETAKAKMTLPEAVFYAGKNTGGAPIAAALERVDRTSGYQISFLDKKTGAVQEVWVSPDNPPISISD